MMRFIQCGVQENKCGERKESFTHSPTQLKTHLRKSYWKISILIMYTTVLRRLLLLFLHRKKQRNTKFISRWIWEESSQEKNRRKFLLANKQLWKIMELNVVWWMIYQNPWKFTREFTLTGSLLDTSSL